MKQLSSHLSRPRRRVYSLLAAGLAVATLATVLGGLIFGLGRSRPDIIMSFWECGEYVLLLGVINLGIYGALLWQMRRLSRRERRPPAVEHPSILHTADGDDAPEEGAPGVGSAARPAPPPGAPRRISRQVRGTPSSLNLDP